MASTAEKSKNLLVVCCLCLLSNSFHLGRRKQYPHRKCSYSNRKRASMIRINKTDLSPSKECLCVRCSHVVATAYVTLFLVCLKSDADYWRPPNLCIFPKKRAQYKSALSPAPQIQTFFSPAPLGSWRRTAETHHKRPACLYSSVCQPALKTSTTDVPVKFTQKQHMTDNINFKEPESFTSCSCKSFFLDERLRCFSRTE